MLSKLIIKNFAIIEDALITFDDKMTVLTGQTGSGKSLVVDAISILMGKKAEAVFIRNNCDEAYISCEFNSYNEDVKKILIEEGLIDSNTNILKIERTINKNNRNSIKINNKSINLNLLKKITYYLCDLHLQHDNLKLFDEDNYINLIDYYGNEKIIPLLNKYNLAYYNYNEKLDKYLKTLKKRDTDNKNIDMLKFKYDEINDLNATLEEKTKLEEEIELLSNFDTIYETLNNCKNHLDGDYYSIDNIYNAIKEFSKIEDYKEKYKTLNNTLEESYYNIVDCLNEINSELKNLDYDPSLLDYNIERLNSINTLEKKYNQNIDELNKVKDEIYEQIMLIENYDDYINELKNNLTKEHNNLIKCSLDLSNMRKKIAKNMEKAISLEFEDLCLHNVSLDINFNEIDSNNLDICNNSIFFNNGIDKINFLISLNIGEGFKPLNKVASGGEISRIMLAMKAALIKKFNFSLVVFDEIDTGVSGEVALRIAKKIKELSNYQQIILISHLPQAVALADHQIEIEKYEENNRTYASYKKLNLDERIYSIAKMLSGNVVSSYALSHAKELLKA